MVEGSVNQFVQSKDGLLAADPKTPVLATNDTAGRISRPADFGPQHNSHVVRDVHTRTFTHRRKDWEPDTGACTYKCAVQDVHVRTPCYLLEARLLH